MIHVKYCRRCKKAFDIGTNYDICIECRFKKNEEDIKTMEGVMLISENCKSKEFLFEFNKLLNKYSYYTNERR